MDDQILLQRFFSADGPLARLLPGYTPRAPQIEMAQAVLRTLTSSEGRLVVEAGTGTGKSLAYLAAALASKKRVVVATGTKALQDQLYKKDVPLALKAWAMLLEQEGLPKQRAEPALMKGRQNYLCKLRLERFRLAPMFPILGEARAFDEVVRWAAATTTGDRADVPGLPDQYLTWSEIDAGAETCIGQKCAHFDDCHVTIMRRRGEAATLVVVNHHLLCADQRVRMEAAAEAGASHGAVLPEPQALILDEAHALPDVATEYFGLAVGSTRVERLVRDARALGERMTGDGRAAVIERALALEETTDHLFSSLRPFASGAERARLPGRSALGMDDLVESAAQAARALADKLAAMGEAAFPPPEEQRATGALESAAVARRAHTLAAELRVVLGEAPDDPRFVVFAEGRKRGAQVTAAPIDVGDLLSRTLFAAPIPVVLTSATLAAASDMTAFLKRSGFCAPTVDDDQASAEQQPEPETLVLPSPFDHGRRAALYVPAGLPEPEHPTWTSRFDDEVLFLLSLSRGGALLLFTSHRAMDDAYERLGPALHGSGLTPLKQGQAPKLALLEHLRALDQQGGGVLFATHSFWEGVDVRGRALRVVVIDRLPFKVPSDPIQQARASLARQRGESPFFDIALPEAALTLKQGAGRLLRSVDDAGVVAVLDGRLRTKRYGRVFLDTMPPMTRIGAQKTLVEFWTRFVAPTLALEADGRAAAAPVGIDAAAGAQPAEGQTVVAGATVEQATSEAAPAKKRRRRSKAG